MSLYTTQIFILIKVVLQIKKKTHRWVTVYMRLTQFLLLDVQECWISADNFHFSGPARESRGMCIKTADRRHKSAGTVGYAENKPKCSCEISRFPLQIPLWLHLFTIKTITKFSCVVRFASDFPHSIPPTHYQTHISIPIKTIKPSLCFHCLMLPLNTSVLNVSKSPPHLEQKDIRKAKVAQDGVERLCEVVRVLFVPSGFHYGGRCRTNYST